MMKVLILFGLSFIMLHEYAVCWSDVKSQEPVENALFMHMFDFLHSNQKNNNSKFDIGNLRKIFMKFEDAVLKHLVKGRKKMNGTDVAITDVLKLIDKDNKTLSKDLKKLLKNIPEMHHGKFIRKLRKFLKTVSSRNVSSIPKFKLHNSLIVPVKINEVKKTKKPLHWKQIIKQSGSKISEEEANVSTQAKDEQATENWITKHLAKPHQVLPSVIDLAVEQSASDKEIQDDIDHSEIGKALVKGVLSERNLLLQWASNTSVIRLSADERKKYLDADRMWEKKMAQETKRLLQKLHPADAYVIPDTEEYNRILKAKKMIMAGREAKKLIFGAGSDWSGKDDRESWLALGEQGRKAREKFKREFTDKEFVDKLAKEEEEWIAIDKRAWEKIQNLGKLVKKSSN